MKIENRVDGDVIYVGSLDPGDCFVYNNEVMMVVHGGCPPFIVQVVSLETGRLHGKDSHSHVYPCPNARVVLEPDHD